MGLRLNDSLEKQPPPMVPYSTFSLGRLEAAARIRASSAGPGRERRKNSSSSDSLVFPLPIRTVALALYSIRPYLLPSRL